MRKVLSCVLAMVLLASAVPLAVMPATALYEKKIPCDADENNELTKGELANAILSYMLGEEDFTLDAVGDASWVYAYWSGNPKTITDYYGEDEMFYRPIERIVLPYVEQADLVRALDAKDRIVGVPERIRKEEAYYPDLSKLPSMGTVFKPDYEAVFGLNPDVFLVYHPPWVDCEKLSGIPCIYLGSFKLESFTQTVTAFGYMFDKEEEAEKYIDWNTGWINEIESRTSGLSEDEKPRVFRWWWRSSGGYGHGGSYCEKDAIAGGRNIAEGQELPGRADIDPEWVANQSIDIIVAHAPQSICGYDFDDASEIVAAREDIMNYAELGNTIAVKKGDVYLIDNKHFMCTNTGYAISIAYMAKWFHPDLFEELDPQAIHQEYITEFQRLDFDVSEHGVFVYHPEKYPEGR